MAENDKNKISFTEFQAKERAIAVGKKYLNLFHQLHVIDAGLTVLNKEFIALPDEVVAILGELAGGAKFRQHIQNLKDGLTPIDKIDFDLLPFGEEVFEDKELLKKYVQYDVPRRENIVREERKVYPVREERVTTQHIDEVDSDLANDNAKVIFDLLRKFQNNPKDLEAFKSKEEVRDFGPEWKSKITDLINKSNVPDKANLKKVFDGLCVFDYALNVWQECVALMKNPKLKSVEEIVSKLPEYKKYLNMFGASGKSLYEKIEDLTK
ncbi:hypothetical protein HDR59_02575 [bacterium]|nr:hypothetical protein [bacterium]